MTLIRASITSSTGQSYICPVFVILALLLSQVSGYAQPDTLWMKTYEGVEFYEIISDQAGGYFVSGRYYQGLERYEDIHVVRIDGNGEVIWSRVLNDGRLGSGAFALCYADSSVYLVGWGRSPNDASTLIARVSLEGDSIWYHRDIVRNGDDYLSVLPDTDEGVLVAGSTGRYAEHRPYDGLLVKVNSDGEEVWHRAYGTDDDEHFVEMIRTSEGGLALTGVTRNEDSQVYLVKTDSEGEMEWSGAYGDSGLVEWAEALVQLRDGSYVLAGRSADNETIDGLVLRVSADGDLMWMRTFGERGQYDNERFHDVVVTPSGDIVVAGETAGDPEDVILIRLNPEGDVVWEKWFNLSRFSINIKSIIIAEDNSYILSGYHTGSPPLIIRTEPDTLEENAVVLIDPAFPSSSALSAPYPNPFNSTVHLNYSLPFPSQTSVRIYNQLGHQVAELYDGCVGAGEHSIAWNAAGSPAGTYLFKIVTSGEVSTTRAILVK